MFNTIIEKFADYTLSSDKFVKEVITTVDLYDLNRYLLNDILKLLNKIIINKLSADVLFEKNYWSWGFVTIYYSNFYMAQVLNRIKGDFFLYKGKDFNKNIKYDKTNKLFNIPDENNGENSHKREFKKLKNNFSNIKTWNENNNFDNLTKLLNLTHSQNKDILFKYTIDNEIKESEIRNNINYQLKYYKEIHENKNEYLIYKSNYLDIIKNQNLININSERFELLKINQKRFLFLTIFIKEISNINPGFKIKLKRLNEDLEGKYNNEFHDVSQELKDSIKGLLNEL